MTIFVEPYRPEDRATVEAFNAATQEHERALALDLKTGAEIAIPYTDVILRRVAERDGLILMARSADRAVGFVCAYIKKCYETMRFQAYEVILEKSLI